MPPGSAQGLIAGHGGRQARLERHVATLAGDIGERHVRRPASLTAAAAYIEQQCAAMGQAVRRQSYAIDGQRCDNLEVEYPGHTHREQVIVVGAHYDTVPGSPGANDNASAVAALLELVHAFADRPVRRTLRLVAFTNEEAPFAWTDRMGSKVYADRCRSRREHIAGMLALDGLGCYSDAPGSQRYPLHLGAIYPSRASFLGFVANLASARLLWTTVRAFRRGTTLPAQAALLPGWLPAVARSDHWSFWQHRYPAMLVTDTLPFRDRHYHQSDDTPDKLDYARLALATTGLEHAVAALVGTEPRQSDDRG